ncbi:hypothetical protein ACU4GD_15295, partial [Cupriavidus basilensis]
ATAERAGKAVTAARPGPWRNGMVGRHLLGKVALARPCPPSTSVSWRARPAAAAACGAVAAWGERSPAGAWMVAPTGSVAVAEACAGIIRVL